jgi:DNA-binding beta-propeller fold protein YncE
MANRLLLALAGISFLMFGARLEASPCTPPSQSTTIDVPGHPFAAVASTDGCWLFVSIVHEENKGAVAVLRNQNGTFAVDHTVPLQGFPAGASLTRDGQLLLIATGDDTVALDIGQLKHGGDGALLGKLHDGGDAGAVYTAISPDDKLLFVSDENENRIDVFDLDKARKDAFRDTSPISRVRTASLPVGLAFSPDGQWLYATNQSAGPKSSSAATCEPEQAGGMMHPPGLLLRIDVHKAAKGDAHALAAALPAGCNPVRVAVSPSGTQLWVSARGGNELLRFQAQEWLASSKQTSVKHFPIGTSPVGITVRPDGKQVWVALSNRFNKNATGEMAGLADASADAPQQRLSLPAKGFPREVSFLPDGHTLVATLFNAQQLMLVPTPE